VDIDVDASVAAESSSFLCPLHPPAAPALHFLGSSSMAAPGKPDCTCHAMALCPCPFENDCLTLPLSLAFHSIPAGVRGPSTQRWGPLLHPTPLLLAQQPHRPLQPHHPTPHDTTRRETRRNTKVDWLVQLLPAPATRHTPPLHQTTRHQRPTGQAEKGKPARRDVSRPFPAVPLLQFSSCCVLPSVRVQIPPTNRSGALQHGGGGEGGGSPGAGARARARGGQLRGRRALRAAPQPQGPRRRAAELGPHARQPLHLVPRHLRPRQPRHPPVSRRLLSTLPRSRPLFPAAARLSRGCSGLCVGSVCVDSQLQ